MSYRDSLSYPQYSRRQVLYSDSLKWERASQKNASFFMNWLLGWLFIVFILISTNYLFWVKPKFSVSDNFVSLKTVLVQNIHNTLGLSFGAPSSVLNTLASFRSGPFADISYNSSPDVNEVYPGLFVGDAVAAKDKQFLRRMRINYVLNTAEGKRYTQVDTDHLYYRDCPGLRYKGFQLMDLPSTDISKYFYIAANFIDEAVSSGGRVLVHCMMGVSRSATCALAFLMIKRGMSLAEAIGTVRARRDIHPNEGFIRQLQQLERELRLNRIR